MDAKLNLSIIIPVFNVQKYIEKCFNSIRLINNFSIEIIFVNDGSTDSSLDIINQIALKNSCVKVISQDNLGLSGARNTGIENANGNYILFLDSDDWLNFDVIENLLPLAIKNDLDLLSFGIESFDENLISLGKRPNQLVDYKTIISGQQALVQGFQPSSSCLFLYKKSFLNEFNLKFYPKIAQQDVEFTTRIMLCAKKVYFSDQIGYNYYRHQGTISLPTTIEKLHFYLTSSSKVAFLIKQNLKTFKNLDSKTVNAVQKNYNSVVWNLILRFLVNRKEVDTKFKIETLNNLKLQGLYPIKGKLKSNFQKLIRVFFNFEWLLKFVLKQ